MNEIKPVPNFSFLGFSLVVMFTFSCSNKTEEPELDKSKIMGIAQKGPFEKNSYVILYELEENLEKTGTSYGAYITDDKGHFEVQIYQELSSPYVELEVHGIYKNEVNDNPKHNNDPITLRVIADVANKNNMNVNTLTHLEYNRVIKLVKQNQKTFDEAKKQAQKEVLKALGISGKDFANSEDMSILGKNKSDAALLMASVSMLGGRATAETIKLLDYFSKKIETDGILDDSTKNAIAEEMTFWNWNDVRKNILNWDSYAKTLDFYFIDERDGKIYRTVEIGSLIWTADNLKYNAPGSKCYGNNPANCEEYGRLYDFATAIKACPQGWHIPSDAEWVSLVDFFGKNAGIKLKASSGWGGVNGTDDYEFSALPGGYGFGTDFKEAGHLGYFWSSKEIMQDLSAAWVMNYENNNVDVFSMNKLHLLSARCVKDRFILPPR
jgi:uncharacterized protein (TIGR02145 family)